MTRLPILSTVVSRQKKLHLKLLLFRQSVETKFTTWYEKLPSWLALSLGLIFGIPAFIGWFVVMNLVYFAVFSAIILTPVIAFGVTAWIAERYLAPLIGVEDFDVGSYALGVVIGFVVVGIWTRYRTTNGD